jgi:solute carrier family 35 (UDP-sugar transporter), member A1/2/3
MYQVKMLTTAILSVTMLKKKLKRSQWGGVGLLTAGLVLVQLSQMGPSGGGGGVAGGNTVVGFSAVLTACTLAGFAGCYLERVLKDSATSLWVRNLQLGAWGSLLGAASVLVKDGHSVATKGFFYGYSPVGECST